MISRYTPGNRSRSSPEKITAASCCTRISQHPVTFPATNIPLEFALPPLFPQDTPHFLTSSQRLLPPASFPLSASPLSSAMVTSAQPTSPSPPPIGALIDNGALELVEILGYGGYGIVYRAIDTYSSHPTSYAVKCLPHSNKRSSTRQRQLHIREITLHKLASAHPGVVTLHRVIEDSQYTWIVMDYCGDGDLFTQILHNRRYLGQNDLIREVFLQLLDAVDYCHSLNIYHRDLKPENILCFEDGLRLAITDFGLATTEKMSTEFRTGSVYHMSPGTRFLSPP